MFSFNEPIVSLSRRHIRGENKPNLHKPHPVDEGTLEVAQEPDLSEFTEIATGVERFSLPVTVSREAAASILVDSTPTYMMKAVLVNLLDAGIFTIQRLYYRANIASE